MKPKFLRRASRSAFRLERGVMLIEALVAVAIFSLAVLGIMGLQATSIRTVRDADYRAKASLFAHQIVGQMWVDRFNVPTYALNAGSAACSAGTNAAANPVVTGWLNGLTDATNSGSLPGAASYLQQILVEPNNVVTVTVCWKGPQDTAPHNFALKTQIQG